MCKVGHQTAADRIGSERHDNRYLVRRALGSTDRSFAAGHNHVDGELNQFLRISGEAVQVSASVPLLQQVVAALVVSEVTHAKHELAAQILDRRICARAPFEIAQPHEFTRLRVRRERPCGCAAEQRDEVAPLHSITSSARASSVGGTSRPSAFAVLRLMTSSYFVGVCTGRSAGFSPLRIRSTYPATSRYWSTRPGP